MQIQDKIVLVTGGNRGIGLEIARALSEAGARVAICGRDRAALQSAARNMHGDVKCIEADLASSGSFAMIAEAIEAAFGGLDVLINNAAIQLNYSLFDRPFADLEIDIEREFMIDLVAPVKLTTALLPLLRRSDEGAVVNLGSGLALAPKVNAAVYCASKAGLRNFSRTLRYQAETGAPALRVVDVMLPLVKTAMTEGRGTGKIEPAEVAKAVISGLRQDRNEVLVGRARLLSLIMRLAPAAGYRMLRGNP